MAHDEIIFLGSGGARVVSATQLRSTGGLLFNLDNKLILVDPGPGSLVRFHQYGRPYRIYKLNAIILSHRHLDHSADANIIIDAITEGGKKKRGILFVPGDALDHDPVVLKYLRKSLKEIVTIQEGLDFKLGALEIIFPKQHKHGVETYGIIFKPPHYSIALVTDTDYFDDLKNIYSCDILIINILRPKHTKFPHLSVPEASSIIKAIKPRLTIITHFGMKMIRADPSKIAQKLSEETKTEVIAAQDGLRVNPRKYINV